MTGAVVAELAAGGVGAPLVVALVVGLVKWGVTANALLGKVTELVDDVRELTAAAQDTVLLRAEFSAHCRQADERWSLILGRVSTEVPTPRHAGRERRAHPRAVEAGA